jgi:hypothetical protein
VYSTDEIKKEIKDLRRIRDGKIKPKAQKRTKMYLPKSMASPSLAKLNEMDLLPF